MTFSTELAFRDSNLSTEIINLSTSPSAETSFGAASIISLDTGSGIKGDKGDKGDPGGSTTIKRAADNIGGHRAVALNDTDEVIYASSDNISHIGRLLGITTGAAESGSLINIQCMDYMTESSWSWVPNKPIYLGINGLLTQDINNTGLFVLVIAYALSQTNILINKSQPIIKG